MLIDTLSYYTGIDPNQLEQLLNLTQTQIYENATYQSWVSSLDPHLLEETLPHARAAYEKHLPRFAAILRDEYGMGETTMSAFTLGNWLVGYLHYQNAIVKLSQIHSRIPQAAFRDMLPEMIAMLDDMQQGREEWQCALALMALPLVADRA